MIFRDLNSFNIFWLISHSKYLRDDHALSRDEKLRLSVSAQILWTPHRRAGVWQQVRRADFKEHVLTFSSNCLIRARFGNAMLYCFIPILIFLSISSPKMTVNTNIGARTNKQSWYSISRRWVPGKISTSQEDSNIPEARAAHLSTESPDMWKEW